MSQDAAYGALESFGSCAVDFLHTLSRTLYLVVVRLAFSGVAVLSEYAVRVSLGWGTDW